MNATRLAAWLRRLPSGSIAIQAVFINVEGNEPIYTWELHSPTGTPKKERTRRSEMDLANDILHVLQEDCNGRDYMSRYQVAAVSENGKVLASTNCVQRPEGSTDPADVKSDPSAVGVVSQVLRHNEAMMRMILSSMRTIQEQYHGLLTILNDQVGDMRTREKAVQEIIMESAGRVEQDEVQQAESRAKVYDALAKEIIPRAGIMIETYLKSQQGQAQ